VWRAALTGAEIDLELLGDIFAEGDWIVSKDTAVDGIERWLLITPEIGSATQLEGAAEATRNCVALINSAAMASHNGYRPVELQGQFVDEQGHVSAVALAGLAEARATLRGNATLIGPDGVVIQAPPPPERSWLAKAGSNNDIAEVLELLATQLLPDFVTLYKVLEIVEHDVGNVHRRGWASRAERKAFGLSCNHPAASGRAARHARMPGWIGGAGTMTPLEARAFVCRVVVAWFNDKCAIPEAP